MSARSSKRSASSALVWQLGRHGGDDTRVRLVVCLPPPTTGPENLEPMVRALGADLTGAGHDGHVLVIDDALDRRDGELADRLAAELAFLSVLHRRRKEGPGLRRRPSMPHVEGAELVATIDCDFHDPHDLRGSPRRARGRTSRSARATSPAAAPRTGEHQALRQPGGSLYARTVLGIPVRDTTSGFKVYRREVLEAIRPASIESRGYAFQIETVPGTPGGLHGGGGSPSASRTGPRAARRWARESSWRRCRGWAYPNGGGE